MPLDNEKVELKVQRGDCFCRFIFRSASFVKFMHQRYNTVCQCVCTKDEVCVSEYVSFVCIGVCVSVYVCVCTYVACALYASSNMD